jgi:hypothetical protein
MKNFFYYRYKKEDEYSEVIAELKSLPKLQAPDNFSDQIFAKAQNIQYVQKIRKIEKQENLRYNIYNKFIPAFSLSATLILIGIYFLYYYDPSYGYNAANNYEPISKAELIKELEPVKNKLLICLDDITDNDVVIIKNKNKIKNESDKKIKNVKKVFFNENNREEKIGDIFYENLKSVSFDDNFFDQRYNSERFIGFKLHPQAPSIINHAWIKSDTTNKLK